jgi:stalled ribosome rescue protein Dom34
MKGSYKQFDKNLFEQNDPKSRNIVKDFFKRYNVSLKDNDDQYGVDLVSEDGSIKIEVERRINWNRSEFPFDEINLPERKAKFFKSGDTTYVIVSKDYSHIGIIKRKDIYHYISDQNLKENKNRLVQNKELFYKLPKSKFKWVKL